MLHCYRLSPFLPPLPLLLLSPLSSPSSPLPLFLLLSLLSLQIYGQMKSTVDQLSWVEGLYPSSVAGKIAGGMYIQDTQASFPGPCPASVESNQVAHCTLSLNAEGSGNQIRTWE